MGRGRVEPLEMNRSVPLAAPILIHEGRGLNHSEDEPAPLPWAKRQGFTGPSGSRRAVVASQRAGMIPPGLQPLLLQLQEML
jgi:hypothetical protein